VLALLLTNAALIAVVMLIVWLVSLPRRDVSIVDLIWGLGFVAVAWSSLLLTAHGASAQPAGAPSRWLLPLLTTIWGCRLSGYLAWRNHGLAEDKRYAEMRDRRGASFWWKSLFIVFLLQGALMWIVSLPLQVGIAAATPGWSVWHAVGVAVWSVGLFFETVGDWQLARFKKNARRRDQVLNTGLWRYTRHPNYFGDFCIWWGLFFAALSGQHVVWTAISPLIMSLFLLKVSGVTLLESTLATDKPGYAEYQRRTNAFFPWRPR
jgi:steroid 5-alpha reductase family enzyme